jgi:hypothetical protein
VVQAALVRVEAVAVQLTSMVGVEAAELEVAVVRAVGWGQEAGRALRCSRIRQWSMSSSAHSLLRMRVGVGTRVRANPAKSAEHAGRPPEQPDAMAATAAVAVAAAAVVAAPVASPSAFSG